MVYELDGTRFDSLDGFYAELDDKLGLAPWGHNLDAFNDILRGGFGTPAGGFVLRWRHAERSRVALGYPETIRYLERKLGRCHPTNIPGVRADIEAARRGEGPTLFEILVEIIREHGPGGREAEDGVALELA